MMGHGDFAEKTANTLLALLSVLIILPVIVDNSEAELRPSVSYYTSRAKLFALLTPLIYLPII
jgi:hypothetical protein